MSLIPWDQCMSEVFMKEKLRYTHNTKLAPNVWPTIIRHLIQPPSQPTKLWDVVSIQQPYFHSVPIPVTSQGPTIWPGANWDVSCSHCEDHTKWSILASWLIAQQCGECGILDRPHPAVSRCLRRNIEGGLFPSNRRHWGSIGTCLAGGAWCTPVAILWRNSFPRKNYFMNFPVKGSILRRKC